MAIAQQAKNESKELYEKLARAGFAARGITYGIVGSLALMAAFGSGGGTTGQTGALETLTGSGWGKAVLAFLAIGLFGYGLWRLASAAFDLENEGSDGKAIAKRIAHAASGLTHFALALYAAALAFGATGGSSGGSGGGAESLTAKLMAQPFGVWLVGIAGIIGFIVAGFQIKKALGEEYREHIRLPDAHGFSNKAVKFGIIARAVVFGIIGAFLLYAAFTTNPDNAKGVGGALSWLQQQPYGAILLGAISIGLLGFAFYSFLQARYRIIPDPEQGAKNSVRSVAS
ncbi:DUF1206 domain-containing protein [Parvularcula maris]|uniref:DUF1206 domain-containing protein n=1 Tax=Parvularcula maris TaxID=2965077 RepID=A0A9X2RHW6_9PROT|nr:DUF1206 domain-containing protein [Parvularcula maris]MCQ8185324.1 DUF1206 domain-containing protein [Parvularcula maris]